MNPPERPGLQGTEAGVIPIILGATAVTVIVVIAGIVLTIVCRG